MKNLEMEILNNITNGVMMTDDCGNIIMTNRECENFLKRNSIDIIHHSICTFSIYHNNTNIPIKIEEIQDLIFSENTNSLKIDIADSLINPSKLIEGTLYQYLDNNKRGLYLIFDSNQSKDKDKDKDKDNQIDSLKSLKSLNSMLAKHKRILSDLIENAPIGMLVCDIEGNITFANQRLANLLGSPSIEATMAINLLTFPLLKKSQLSSKLISCLKTKEEKIYEERYISKWGKTLWMKVIIQPLVENDIIIGASIVIDNVTEKRLSQKRLFESENNFRSFFESSNNIFMVLDTNYNIIHVNPAAIKILDYTLDELININFISLHNKRHQPQIKELLAKVKETKAITFNYSIISKEQSNIPFESTCWFGMWNDQDVVFVSCKDLSSEQEAHMKFNHLFHYNPAPMTIASSPENLFTNVNQAFLEKTGYTKQEVIGKSPDELRILVNNMKSTELSKKLLKNDIVRNLEMSLKTKDGHILEGMFSGVVIKNNSKTMFLSVMMDITELRAYQRQIEYLSYHDQLTNLYNRRFFELELQNLKDGHISIMVADVNGLKALNDLYGHLSGDELLKKVAHELKKHFSKHAIVSRIGGDEFCVVSKTLKFNEMESLIQNAKKSLSALIIKGLPISVSFGFSSGDLATKDAFEIFKEADEKMYENKQKYKEIKSMQP